MTATDTGVVDQLPEGTVDANETTETTTEQAPPPGSPAARRLEALDAIGAGRAKELALEMGVESITDDENPPAEDTDPVESLSTPADQVAAQLTDDGLVPAEMLGRKVRLKVDGREQDVTLEQLVRDAQKSQAADQRLAEATAILRAAQETRQQETRQQETVTTIPPSTPPTPPQPEARKAKLKDALAALLSGDEDAAADAFEAVLGQPQPTAVAAPDTEAIADVVSQRLDERSALVKFFGDYPRIASNPYLQAAADDALAQYKAEGKSFQEALKLSGDAVYQQFGYEREPAAPPNAEPTTTRADAVQARKANLDVPVGRTMSIAQASAPPMSSEQTRSLTIAEMAARRRPQARTAG